MILPIRSFIQQVFIESAYCAKHSSKSVVLNQQFCPSTLSPPGIFGNVCGHFWLPQLGGRVLLASSGQR